MWTKTILLTAVLAGGTLCAQQRAPFRTTQEAVRYYEDLVGTLTRQVKSMQDENAMLSATSADLKRRVERLEADNRTIMQTVESLRKQIAADAEVRKNQLNRLADKLTAQPAPAATTTSKRRTAVKKEEASAEKEQEYVEHKVAPGTTLSALAKAYKVSVKDIIKANNLKNGRIYAGQKLLIPVSSK